MDRLTEDCIAARKAGMSYGKYMAANYKPPQPKPEPKPKPEQQPSLDRLCIICRKPFYAYVHNQKCCSPKCSNVHRRRYVAEYNGKKYAERKAQNDR